VERTINIHGNINTTPVTCWCLQFPTPDRDTVYEQTWLLQL